jgi:hypothetical protein
MRRAKWLVPAPMSATTVPLASVSASRAFSGSAVRSRSARSSQSAPPKSIAGAILRPMYTSDAGPGGGRGARATPASRRDGARGDARVVAGAREQAASVRTRAGRARAGRMRGKGSSPARPAAGRAAHGAAPARHGPGYAALRRVLHRHACALPWHDCASDAGTAVLRVLGCVRADVAPVRDALGRAGAGGGRVGAREARARATLRRTRAALRCTRAWRSCARVSLRRAQPEGRCGRAKGGHVQVRGGRTQGAGARSQAGVPSG